MGRLTQPGTTVRVRGERWRVAHVDSYASCAVLALEGLDPTNRQHRLRVVEPFDRPEHATQRTRVCGSRRTVLHAALSAIIHERPAGGLWSAATAAIDLLPYQLEPALAVLRGATRVLLADEVGLGKTIQAALIVAELRARGWIERVLIACPPALRTAWASELTRFGITSDIVDLAALAEAAARLPPGINPWSSRGCTIVSLDFLKRPDVVAALAAVPIDVLIADEAHHLTPRTERGSAIASVASRSPWCIFASATPHSGDVEAYEYLCGLGGHGDALTIFRRTRSDIGIDTHRRTRLARVTARGADQDCVAAVETYVRDMWRGRGASDAAVRLVATVIARRAASTPLALERTLIRRRQLLGNELEATQPLLPWEDLDDEDDSGAPSLLGRPGLASAADEERVLDRLIGLARACGPGAKIAAVRRLLRRIHEPAIIFTEYRDSVEAVLAALPSSICAGSVTGAMPADARLDAVERFNRRDLDLLVATDCAGEGLNLHHRCRLVIDLELPWNPLRLEQRIGRVDRLGQRRRVHAIRFFLGRSIEERVLECLRAREQRSHAVATTQPAGVTEMAEAIFEGVPLPDDPLPAAAPSDRASRVEAARLERQRAHAAAAPDDVCVCRPRRTPARTLVVVYEVGFADAHGGLVSVRAEAAAVDVRAWMNRREAVALMRAAPGSPVLIEHVRRCSMANGADIERQRQPLCSAIESRIGEIRRHLGERRVTAVQGSLFDSRAEQAAARMTATTARLDEALAGRLAVVASPLVEHGVAIRPVAIWPIRSRP
jgi:superfamily II DNA or RNA helicase